MNARKTVTAAVGTGNASTAPVSDSPLAEVSKPSSSSKRVLKKPNQKLPSQTQGFQTQGSQTEAKQTQTTLVLDALLEAHVQYWIKKVTLNKLDANISQFIDMGLSAAQNITLEDAVSRDIIKDLIRIYALDLNLGGGLLELIGEIMQRVVTALQANSTTLGDMITDTLMAQWIDKASELEDFYRAILTSVLQSKYLPDLLARFVSEIVVKQTPDWLQQQHYASQHQQKKVSNSYKKSYSLLQRSLDKITGQLQRSTQQALSIAEESFALTLANGFRQLQQLLYANNKLLILDKEDLEDLLMRSWQMIKHRSLSSLMVGLDVVDFTEFFILVYESWLGYRKTTPLKDIIYSSVDVLFDIYGEESLADLLADTGVTKDHLIYEGKRFIPILIQTLQKTNMLQPFIRFVLQDFYTNLETAAVVQSVLAEKS